jgi:hypothetical protein
MITYHFSRIFHNAAVFVTAPLGERGTQMTQLVPNESTKLSNLSKDFNWGDTNPGQKWSTLQLALALLWHATRDRELSLRLYKDFAHEKLASAPWLKWDMTQEELLQWISHHHPA